MKKRKKKYTDMISCERTHDIFPLIKSKAPMTFSRDFAENHAEEKKKEEENGEKRGFSPRYLYFRH